MRSAAPASWRPGPAAAETVDTVDQAVVMVLADTVDVEAGMPPWCIAPNSLEAPAPGSPPNPGRAPPLWGFSDGALKPGWIVHDGPASETELAVRGLGIRWLDSILLADPAQRRVAARTGRSAAEGERVGQVRAVRKMRSIAGAR